LSPQDVSRQTGRGAKDHPHQVGIEDILEEVHERWITETS